MSSPGWTVDLRPRATAQSARGRAAVLAAQQGGIVTRGQLRAAGLPPWFAHEQVAVGRWARTGRRTVAVHNGPLTQEGLWWLAVLELGPRAALSGVSALQRDGAGIAGDGLTHVIVPKGAAPHQMVGVRIHESRRFEETDLVDGGLRRTRPAVAAVHAALWARTDREAALMITVVVQQRLAGPELVLDALGSVRRHPRRRALLRVAEALTGGVRSLGELDVDRRMAARGLPEPVRQSVRRRPSGLQYLDAEFPAYALCLEVDGRQHNEPLQVLSDTLRDLDLGAEGRTVVRLPLTAWYLDTEAVLDALERLFVARGWRRY